MAGPFAPGNESSCKLSLPGTLVPGTFPLLIQNITMRYATYSRLMALPLLPVAYIQPAFNNLHDSLSDDVDERQRQLDQQPVAATQLVVCFSVIQ